MGKRRNKDIPKYDKGINNSCYPAKEQSRKQSEDVSFTIGEVSSDAAAAEILANVCTHRAYGSFKGGRRDVVRGEI